MVTVLATDVSALSSSVNTVWMLTVGFLIFFMQPGFLMLEAGQVQSKNVATVAMKNMYDWSLGVLVFFVAGLGIAKFVGDLTSPGGVSLAESFAYVNAPGEWVGWFFGAVFAMTAATIVSGAVAERVKFKSYIVYSVVLTMIIYPTVVGLTWQGGLLSAEGYLGQLLGVGYLDFAGGTVVHMVGGIAGLTAAYMIGPRKDRYDEDGDSRPIPGHSVLFAVLGTLFLAFGWFGFNVGTQATVLTEGGEFLGEELGRVVLVTTLGMGAGAVGSSIVTIFYLGKPDPLFTANGLLAGLVAVTGAVPHVTWWGGLLLGGLGGALVYPTFTWTVDSLGVDDVCGVFAVHGGAGGIGVALIPLFGVGSAGGWAFLGVNQLAMQIIGVALIGTWTVLTTMGVFLALQATLGLRVDEEAETEGLDEWEHNVRAYPQFVTDGGVDASSGSSASSQGSQEADNEATMWRGEEIAMDSSAGVLDGAGIENFPDPTFVVDDSNEVTAINPPAIRFFEVLEEEALEAHPAELVRDEDGVLTAPNQAMSTDREVRDMRGTVTVGTDEVPVSVTATPLREGGEVVGAMATVRNTAEEVARERHRQTVEDYREDGLQTQREKLDELADGNLDIESGVPEPPEDGESFDHLYETFQAMDESMVETAENIRAIVEKLPGQSEELAESSESLSASSEEVSTGLGEIDDLTTEIDSEVDQLAQQTADANDNVSELSAAIEQISASAAEIRAQSSEAADLTEEGVDEMTEAVGQIRTATEHSETVASEIDSLEERMDSVANIVDIIQDIAEQTNMLALNASIEAANANASGDGFAVVAEEVKSLAEQTKGSADDIADIINDVQRQTDQVVSTIRDANEEIEQGADAVENTVTTLEAVQDRVEETNTGVEEISAAVDRQAENTERVSASMQDVTTKIDDIGDLAGRISELTDIQTAEMEDVSGLADRLNAIANEVHGNIDQFDLAASLDAHHRTPTSR